MTPRPQWDKITAMDDGRPEGSIHAPLDPKGVADRAWAARERGETIPHSQMKTWLEALARGEDPRPPKTDAEIEVERSLRIAGWRNIGENSHGESTFRRR
jgi:hypothetical protein